MAPTTRKRAMNTASPDLTSANTAAYSQPAQDSEDDGLSDGLSDLSSTHSDYEVNDTKKRKRATNKAEESKPKRRLTAFDDPRQAPLPLPGLPDDEKDPTVDESEGESDFDGLFSKDRCHNAKASVETKKNEASPTLVHQAGVAVISTTLEDFLKNSNIVKLLKDPNTVDLLKNAGLQIMSVPPLSSAGIMKAHPENIEPGNCKKGFLDLPYELHEKIYRLVLIFGYPVDFNANRNHYHSAQFLKTCKTVYDEGRAVLYGENSFHLSRDTRFKGEFHELWTEVGYKGVRKFFERIGPHNVKLLKHVSISLSDGADNRTRPAPGSIEYPRFVDDPHVHECLRLLAANPALKTFAIQFASRKVVSVHDRRLVRGVTDIKCWKFIIMKHVHGQSHKCAPGLIDKMKFLMKVRDESGAYDTLPQVKNPVKMVYSFDSPTWRYADFQEVL